MTEKKTDRRRKAATTQLEPGEHSIDRNTPTTRVLHGREVIVLDWSIRLKDGRLIRRRTQGKSNAGVRRKAKATAADLMVAGARKTNTWTPRSSVVTYIDKVVIPGIEQADLRPLSVTAYKRAARVLRDQLAGHSIASAWRYDVLVDALEKVAAKYTPDLANQSRIVINKYMSQPMRRHVLTETNPLQGARLNLERFAKPKNPAAPKRGGRALTADEQERMTVHLLQLDPAKERSKAVNPIPVEVRIRKRAQIIDLTLLQIGAAPRLSECLRLHRTHFFERDGVLHLDVTEEVSKTRIPRQTPIPDERIANRIREKLASMESDEEYLFGKPSDPMIAWRRGSAGSATEAVAEFYIEVAKDLGIELLEFQRSHVWRTTLSKRYEEAGVSREYYAAILGHTESINKRSYTDRTDTSAITTAWRKAHDSDAGKAGGDG